MERSARGKRKAPPWARPLVYGAVRLAATGAFSAPLRGSVETAAALGRWWGQSPPNRKRLERAVSHIEQAFPDWERGRCEQVALASYEHLFRLVVEFGQSPRLLSPTGWLGHVALAEIREAARSLSSSRPVVLISGHCGNWEILGYTMALLGTPLHALYRPLDNRPLDQWLRRTRAQRGLSLVDKFGAAERLPRMVAQGTPVGFVADQNAGDRGLFVPFFGRLASTYKSIGLLAIKERATVICGAGRRVSEGELLDQPDVRGIDGLMPSGLRHRLEVVDVIRPEDWEDREDPLFYLTARYRHAIERMVRRAPEQYLWMHRMWRSRPAHERRGRPFPESLKRKLHDLPWLSDEDAERIVDRSDRDARLLAELGVSRLP